VREYFIGFALNPEEEEEKSSTKAVIKGEGQGGN
jgi:hypothetical protein